MFSAGTAGYPGFTHFEGVATGHLVATRSFQLARRDFQLIVEFGSAGAASRLLSDVNRLLASVVVAQSR